MAKIYLSPAAHEHDRKCAYDSACSENTHCNLYIDQMIPYLDACGIEWKRSNKANTGDRYDITIAESNAFEPDIHYVAHTNAFNGTVKGSRLHVYWSDSKSREWGQKVLDWRKKIYPYPVSLKDGSGLGEVKKTKAVCLYEELIFHDNVADAAWLHEHMREMAEYTVRAICYILGVTFVDPYTKPEEPEETMYRPQVGAFKEKANAERMAVELKAKGYSTYIVQMDGLYKVQTGAFRARDNADRMADKLKADGYTVYISTTGGDPVKKPTEPVKPAKPTLRVGAKVRCSNVRVHATATGSGAGASVSGEYEVTRYLPERPYGVHIGGLGWIRPSDCTVIG